MERSAPQCRKGIGNIGPRHQRIDGLHSQPLDNAFIGANTVICNSVTIGRNAVVGAGSVVTKDIPDNEIWGGNPAHFIKKRII